MQVPFADPVPLMQQHHHHREPQRPQEDSEHQGSQQPCVGLIRNQAVGVWGEPRIVVRGDGIEDPVPGSTTQAFPVTPEAGAQPQGEQELDDDGGRDDDAQQRTDLTQPPRGGHVEGLLSQELPTDAEPLGHCEREDRRQGEDAETAHEDGHQDHDLPEQRPVCGGGDHRQAGDAHGGDGGEEGVHERGQVTVRCGHRKAQQDRHHEDEGQEDTDGEAGRGTGRKPIHEVACTVEEAKGHVRACVLFGWGACGHGVQDSLIGRLHGQRPFNHCRRRELACSRDLQHLIPRCGSDL